MCREMEELCAESMEIGEVRGRAEGELKKAKETALALHDMGMEIEKIARAIKFSTEDIQQWLNEAGK